MGNAVISRMWSFHPPLPHACQLSYLFALAVLSSSAIPVPQSRNTDVSVALSDQLPIYSKNGVLNVTIEVTSCRVDTGPTAFTTRCYRVPGQPALLRAHGPTLYLFPGEVLAVTLVNLLGADGDLSPKNVYNHPNYTNLHMHGFHISPSSPADNVSITVKPGDTVKYIYKMPLSHPAGTFYYHPHRHGSVALQRAGGLSGVVVVRDLPNTTAPPVDSMVEHVVLLQQVDLTTPPAIPLADETTTLESYLAMSDTAGSTLDAAITVHQDISTMRYTVVGSKYMPTLTIQTGVWNRLRIVNAAVDMHYALFLNTTAQCQIKAIAADGIYLSDTRHVSNRNPAVVPPGGRADLIVYCSTAGEATLVSMGNCKSTSICRTRLQWYGYRTDFSNDQLMNVMIQGESIPSPAPTFTMPAVERSLLSVPDDQVEKFNVEWTMVHGHLLGGVVSFGINGKSFDPDVILHRMKLGSVQEWTVGFSDIAMAHAAGLAHPFHIHVNSFQIVKITAPNSTFNPRHVSEYGGGDVLARVGDWRDTLDTPVGGGFTMRFKAEDFTGKFPFHCHEAQHSDYGMMANVIIE